MELTVCELRNVMFFNLSVQSRAEQISAPYTYNYIGLYIGVT